MQDLIDEILRRQQRESLVEGNLEEDVDAQRGQSLGAAGGVGQAKGRRVGLEQAARMRLEGDHRNRRAGRLSDRPGALQDRAVAAMDAVEIAERADTAALGGANLVKGLDNDHGTARATVAAFRMRAKDVGADYTRVVEIGQYTSRAARPDAPRFLEETEDMAIDPAAIEAGADRLITLFEKGGQTDGLPEACAGLSVADGYAIQKSLLARLTGDIESARVGYKIGATNAMARQLLNADHPFHGSLLADRCYRSPAVLDSARLNKLAVEPELALVLGADLPAGVDPHTADSVAAAVAQVCRRWRLSIPASPPGPRSACPRWSPTMASTPFGSRARRVPWPAST